METGGRSNGRPEVGNSTGGTFTRSFLPSLNLSDAGLEPAHLPSVPAGLNIWLVQEWLKVTIPCKPSQRGCGRLRFHRELVSTAKVVGFDKNAMAFSINGALRERVCSATRVQILAAFWVSAQASAFSNCSAKQDHLASAHLSASCWSIKYRSKLGGKVQTGTVLRMLRTRKIAESSGWASN